MTGRCHHADIKYIESAVQPMLCSCMPLGTPCACACAVACAHASHAHLARCCVQYTAAMAQPYTTLHWNVMAWLPTEGFRYAYAVPHAAVAPYKKATADRSESLRPLRSTRLRSCEIREWL